jgi:transposase-like protein
MESKIEENMEEKQIIIPMISKFLCRKCQKSLKNDTYGSLCEDCWTDGKAGLIKSFAPIKIERKK